MKFELLAPAGDFSKLKTALYFGADAVYVGGKQFSLRALAGNFTDEALAEAVGYTHRCGKKIYVTVNIFAKNGDLAAAERYFAFLESVGADAAIVSDPGLIFLAQNCAPRLPIHLSTQANTTNRLSAEFWAKTGVKRVVLAREMRLEDVAALRRALSPDMALEAFVHGAMCVAYSGRCLLSAALTGRSANRGACAQPCRWRYHLTEEKRPGEYLPVYEDERGTYLYSAGDLCMIGHLDRLRDAGVASLKIEGRMKTAYYVATVVSAYRRALDLLEREGAEAYRRAVPELLAEVRKASHRTLTTGFYFGPPETPGGAEGFTQSMEYVGDVVAGAPDGGECLVRLKNRFYVGDALEVLTPAGPRAFTVSRMTLDTTGESVQTASVAGTLLRMPIPGGAEAGDLLRGPCRNHRSL